MQLERQGAGFLVWAESQVRPYKWGSSFLHVGTYPRPPEYGIRTFLDWAILRICVPILNSQGCPWTTPSMIILELSSVQPKLTYTLVLLVLTGKSIMVQFWPSLTGLDPVEASFEGTPEEVRLDPSDADFVDVIHTDAAPLIPFMGKPWCCAPYWVHEHAHECFNQEGLALWETHYYSQLAGLGSKEMMGHLDFFPNGGKEMPGCKKNALSQIVDLEGIWAGKKLNKAGIPLSWTEQQLSKSKSSKGRTRKIV